MQPVNNQIQGYGASYRQLDNAYNGNGISGRQASLGGAGHHKQGRGLPQVSGQAGGTGNFITPAEQRLDKLKEQFDEKTLKRMGVVECATCASRSYQDGSNDPGVSFKSPQHISPEMSGSVVMGHEMEHVTREQSEAEMNDREVISQSVQLFTAVCPECGKSYVSGGVTKTTTGAKNTGNNENMNPTQAYGKASQRNTEGNLMDITL